MLSLSKKFFIKNNEFFLFIKIKFSKNKEKPKATALIIL